MKLPEYVFTLKITPVKSLILFDNQADKSYINLIKNKS